MVTQPDLESAEPDPPRPERLYALAPAAIEDEIALRDIFLKIWWGKWIVLATMAVALGLAVIWLKITDPLYTASMVIAPAADTSGAAAASGLSQYAGLASLAGVNLPSSETVSSFDQFTELVSSVTLALRLQEKPGMLQKVFEKNWDAENERWQKPDGLAGFVKVEVRGFFGLPDWTPPSATTLATYLQEELELSPIGASGMRTMEFSHEDPRFAIEFLGLVHREVDEFLRERTLERTSRQIEYIENELSKVTIAEHRQSLVQLLSEQAKVMMMTQVGLPFAADVIERPMVSDVPTFPNHLLVLALAVTGSLFLGVFLVFLIDALRAEAPGRVRTSVS